MISANCCCGEKIGFDNVFAWPITFCFPDKTFIIALQQDISRLSECKLVFAGLNNACAPAIVFGLPQWPTVKNYIRSGGRLWLQLEYGSHPSPFIPGCLGDPATVAAFLTEMGTTITWIGDQYDIGCANDGTRDCIAGVANIAQGVSLRMAATAELSGGTNVWKSPSGKNMVQVEKLGNGFLFVSGDSNLSDGCGYDNCAFFKRLFDYEDGQII